MSYYQWPASALTAEEMALLHRAREQSSPRIPINRLLAQAVRLAFGERTGDAPVPVVSIHPTPPDIQEVAA